jgi:hypothetical protein
MKITNLLAAAGAILAISGGVALAAEACECCKDMAADADMSCCDEMKADDGAATPAPEPSSNADAAPTSPEA